MLGDATFFSKSVRQLGLVGMAASIELLVGEWAESTRTVAGAELDDKSALKCLGGLETWNIL